MAENEDRFYRLTDEANDVLSNATRLARELRHTNVTSGHLLEALLSSTAVKAELVKVAVTPDSMRATLREAMPAGPSATGSPSPEADDYTKDIISRAIGADYDRLHLKSGIDCLNLLLAVSDPASKGVGAEVLRNTVNIAKLRANLEGSVSGPAANADLIPEPKYPATPALDGFSIDFTKEVRTGKAPVIVGHEALYLSITEILQKEQQRNVVLTGKPGVGKTAAVRGFARWIQTEDAPESVRGKRVLSLDLGGMVSGTRYRGDFEERLKKVLAELRGLGDNSPIVFIDELHTVIGAGAAEGALDASQMLKTGLEEGLFMCLAATTLDEWDKRIANKDAAFAERFTVKNVEEPTIAQTIDILEGRLPKLELHHGVTATPEALESAAVLADRYIMDKRPPRSTVNLIDRAMSRRRLRVAREGADPVTTADDVAEIVSEWTGIPVAKLTLEESERLLAMETEIGVSVIGQPHALKTVSDAVRRSKAGISDPKRPTGSFLFLGPTGVGKTLLARKLALFLFGDEKAFTKINMAEFSEKHTVSRFSGSAPGYIGYEEGGQLTNAVKRKPYQVVLFDEVEKAHPDVYDQLLGVLDDGILNDAQGHSISFKNTILILTSNLGTAASKGGSLGFASADADPNAEADKRVLDAAKAHFKPEFLNRLDGVVVFHSLELASMNLILDVELTTVLDRIKARGLDVEVTKDARAWLLKNGFDPIYNARPMTKLIENTVSTPAANALLGLKETAGKKLIIGANDTGIVVTSAAITEVAVAGKKAPRAHRAAAKPPTAPKAPATVEGGVR